jgi:hypothetical protein
MSRAQVTASRLNVRTGPGTAFRSVGQLRQGAIVELVEFEGWVPIIVNGEIRWVSGQYLEIYEPQVVSEITPEFNYATKEGNIEAIIYECQRQGLGLPIQIAYVLATVHWETNNTFLPVEEAYYLGARAEQWRKANLRYWPFYGRGHVQLTWEDNYRRMTPHLRERFPGEDIDLVARPEQALVPKYSIFILVFGFRTGLFTGRKLADYITEAKQDLRQARRCINVLDKADEIAALARQYLGRVQNA